MFQILLFVDTTAPVIVLVGDAIVNHELGVVYADDGTTVTDTGDTAGSIDTAVVTGGDTVLSNTAGTYVITFDATDAVGHNAIQVTRTVIVAGKYKSQHEIRLSFISKVGVFICFIVF